MNQQLFNPWAPPYLNGYNENSPETCHDVDAAYVYPENETLQLLLPNVPLFIDIVLDDGADFQLNAFQWGLGADEATPGDYPGFLYRIKDDQGQFIQEGFIYSYTTPGTFANPWPIFPSVTYAAGQRIQAEVLSASATVNQAIQLVFRGFKRFPRIG